MTLAPRSSLPSATPPCWNSAPFVARCRNTIVSCGALQLGDYQRAACPHSFLPLTHAYQHQSDTLFIWHCTPFCFAKRKTHKKVPLHQHFPLWEQGCSFELPVGPILILSPSPVTRATAYVCHPAQCRASSLSLFAPCRFEFCGVWSASMRCTLPFLSQLFPCHFLRLLNLETLYLTDSCCGCFRV